MNEPRVPTDVDLRQLDRRVRAELRGLPKELADMVAAHLLVAGQLIEEDPERAYAHAEAARRRAARLPIVREATAETAYAAEKWDVALSEYRALRRMTGGNEYLPVMADCERALGKPDAALKLVREGRALGLDTEIGPDTWSELRIVEAGARDDLGQRSEAKRVLTEAIQQLGRIATRKRPDVRTGLARLHYALAELHAGDGENADARAMFGTAADLDVEDSTDAQERLDLLDGMVIELSEEDEEDEGVLRQAQDGGDRAQGEGVLRQAQDGGDRAQYGGDRAQGEGVLRQAQDEGDRAQDEGDRAQDEGDRAQDGGDRAQGEGVLRQAQDGGDRAQDEGVLRQAQDGGGQAQDEGGQAQDEGDHEGERDA